MSRLSFIIKMHNHVTVIDGISKFALFDTL